MAEAGLISFSRSRGKTSFGTSIQRPVVVCSQGSFSRSTTSRTMVPLEVLYRVKERTEDDMRVDGTAFCRNLKHEGLSIEVA